MKSLLLVTSVIFSTMTTIAQTADDDTQIKQLIKTIEEGWAKKDGGLFAKSFAENADYVVVNGMYLKGRTAIAQGHQRIFDTFYKETNIKSELQSIRYLRPDIAITHLISNLTGVSNGQQLNNRGYITLTLEKTAAGWQIAAFQNTPIQPPPAATGH